MLLNKAGLIALLYLVSCLIVQGICVYPDIITVYSPGEYASKHKPEEYIKDNIESEIRENGFKFIVYRQDLQSDIPSVTLKVTLNGDGGSCHIEAETRFIKG